MHHDFSQDDWHAYARAYDTLLCLSPYRRLLESAADAVLASKSRSILDAACGSGNLARFLKMKGGHHIRLCGIDQSSAMLERAAFKYMSLGGTVQPASLDLALPFEQETFDCIVSINTLYAVRSPKHTLHEFRRVLQQGGSLILATFKSGNENGLILKEHCGSTKPDVYWTGLHKDPEREAALIREALPNPIFHEDALFIAHCNRLINEDQDFHFYTKESLLSLLRQTGFAVQKCFLAYAKQCFFITAHAI